MTTNDSTTSDEETDSSDDREMPKPEPPRGGTRPPGE